MAARTRSHESDPPAPLPFDRRGAHRWAMDGVATAMRLGGQEFGQLHDLSLVDCSHGGVGAICDVPIEPGTIVSIGFSNPGHLARRGTVKRCAPCGHGYHIAIQFQMGLAA